MRVCEICREGDVVCVDGVPVDSVETAYRKFRTLYNTALGKANYLKLGHRGDRQSRYTKPGIVFTPEYRNNLVSTYSGTPSVKCYLLGILGPVYCKIVGWLDFVEQYGSYDEEQVNTYLDWVFCKGSKMLRQYARRNLKQTNKKYSNGRKH